MLAAPETAYDVWEVLALAMVPPLPPLGSDAKVSGHIWDLMMFREVRGGGDVVLLAVVLHNSLAAPLALFCIVVIDPHIITEVFIFEYRLQTIFTHFLQCDTK